MRLKSGICLIAAFLCTASAAAQQPVTLDDLLQRMAQLGVDAAKLRNQQQAVVPILVPAGADLQKAVDAAPAGSILAMEPGATYGSVDIRKPLTLTSRDWVKGDRLVTPADAPAMATIQATAGVTILVHADDVTLVGFQVLWNKPAGAGELIRIGESEDPDLANVPANTVVSQMLLRGSDSATFGQKRGIAANGRNTLIQWSWCDRIWVPGQDSQCIAAWSTPGGLKIQDNALSAAGENILIGGTPPASPAHFPENVDILRNALWKPRAWMVGDHQAKNLLELKFARNVVIRGNWLENNWVAAQAGSAVLFTMAINGKCTWCELSGVLFEQNVIWNVAAGLNILGHSYILNYGPSGQTHGIVVRNNLWYIDGAGNKGGNGRPVMIGSEPKDVAILQNTFIFNGSALVDAYYGKKFPLGATAPMDGGPVTGFRFEDNVGRHARYGAFTTAGHTGNGLPVFFPGGILAGNVLADTPAAARPKYDAASGGRPNVYPDLATFDAAFRDRSALDLCLKDGTFPGKGADCSQLPFHLRKLIPVDAAGQ